MGWTFTIPFLMIPFGLFAKTHDYHRAFTNDPDRDPDHWVIAATHLSSMLYFASTISMSVALIIMGYGLELLVVGVIPAFLVSFILGMLFNRVPHTPIRQQGRYQNTRSYLFPGLRFLTLGQNYHHIHHLYPRVSGYHH